MEGERAKGEERGVPRSIDAGRAKMLIDQPSWWLYGETVRIRLLGNVLYGQDEVRGVVLGTDGVGLMLEWSGNSAKVRGRGMRIFFPWSGILAIEVEDTEANGTPEDR